MDFTLNLEQQALADTAARWCAKEYHPAARKERLQEGHGSIGPHWGAMAEMGWHGASVPEADGGFGGGIVETAILMEAFGRALLVEPFLSSSVMALQTLAALPAGEVRDALIARSIAGECVLSLAHAAGTEGGVNGIRGEASKRPESWTLSGSTLLTPGAPLATHILFAAHRPEGPALFLADAASVASMARPYRTLDNHQVADFILADAPVTALETDSTRAAFALEHAMAHSLIAQCAEAVGAMDAAIALTTDYVRTRRQFGQTLNSFQAVQHRLADMLVEAELSRSILYGGMAALAHAGDTRTRALSAMKSVVASAALFVGRQAVQLHGAIGVTEDCFVSHLYRRLFVIAGQFGNESFHLARMTRIPPDDADAPCLGTATRQTARSTP
jgi:alkylation response protein AidB-like acyl-CoA dehydrogenase